MPLFRAHARVRARISARTRACACACVFMRVRARSCLCVCDRECWGGDGGARGREGGEVGGWLWGGGWMAF